MAAGPASAGLRNFACYNNPMDSCKVPAKLLFALTLAPFAAAQTSTYIGGTASISLAKIAANASGNVYAAGTELVALPGYTAHSVFVAKTDPNGATVYATRFGGKGDDLPAAIAVDATGHVFVAGATTSPDFPLLNPIQSQPSQAGATGFVFCLDASGQLLWSTYFGGVTSGKGTNLNGNSITALTVDSAGNVYIAGTSEDSDLPTTQGVFQPTSSFSTVTAQISNGFVAKLSPTGRLIYCTWLSGSLINCNSQVCAYDGQRIDSPTAIAVDGTGAAYITGYTDSSDFPTTTGVYSGKPCCESLLQTYSAFLSKLSPDAATLAYSTFLETLGYRSTPPASGLNHSLIVDGSGNAYVAFGTTGPFEVDLGGNPTMPIGPSHIQLMELNPSGSSALLSVMLPASRCEFVWYTPGH